MNSKRDDEQWIKTELVPSLLADGKLIIAQHLKPATLRSVLVTRLLSLDSFMLTVCYKVTVELAESNDESAAASLVKLVVKITPDIDKEWYRSLNFVELFQNEEIAYEQIFPKLGWTDLFPKFYCSHIGPTKCYIVLGDFAADGWRMCTEKINVSLEHALLSLAELGKFHGTMFALKHNDRNAFDHLKNSLLEARYVRDFTNMTYERIMRLGTQRAADSVRSHPEASNIIPEAFLQRMDDLMANTYLYQKTKVAPKEPLAILTHGDFLRNNLAFRYSSGKPDLPEDVMMFDFQTLRYSSPMVDFTTFIANSTGADVRALHFNCMFDTYYDSLIKNYCKNANLPEDRIPAFLSHESMLREYAEYAPYGIAVAASFLLISKLSSKLTVQQFIAISESDKIVSVYEENGDDIDREIRAQMIEMYKLQQRFDVELT